MFRVRVPLWIFLVTVLLAVLGMAAAWRYSKDIIYDYSFLLPRDDGGGSGISLEYGSQPALGNADFFRKVRDQFIRDKVSFIEADLSDMRLVAYQDGSPAKEVPILTKGKKGSWWETPAGLYKIDTKAKNHFSSFGRVYQPWSMAFQGNFFIHGWPYYPGGSPVESDYSGGCVRLSTEDAEAVYEIAKIGMPVLVFEKSFEADDFPYEMKIKASGISARSFLAADIKNNFVFLEKSPKEILPIASITKFITALVATEYVNLEKEITIQDYMIASTSIPRLKAGEKFSLFHLLYPLLLESSNEAANATSYFIGPKRFLELMNEKARALGMANTRLTDASGSNHDNVATAEDLFQLAKHLYFNRSFILQMSAGKVKQSVYGAPAFTDLSNLNLFGDHPEFVGGKTGKSMVAGETMLSIFEVELDGQTRPIAIMVLGSADSGKDTRTLLDYIKASY